MKKYCPAMGGIPIEFIETGFRELEKSLSRLFSDFVYGFFLDLWGGGI